MTFKQDTYLFSGSWNQEVRWEFYSSNNLPPIDLCTAVFCMPFQNDQLLLVQNPKRDWDVTGGHIENHEKNDILTTLKREVLEEGRVSIIEPKLFGYRKIVASVPQKMRDETQTYPFPYSYIPYYIATISTIHDFTPDFETTERKLFSKDEAMAALQRDLNYQIAEFAYKIKSET